jgi:threonine/homoserine/homoserine lactone efflux protein
MIVKKNDAIPIIQRYKIKLKQMNLIYLLKGLILGISVAAPVGPIGILCINRTLNKNFSAGFFSGLGAATADFLYGVIAVFGLTLVSDFLIEQKLWIQLIGIIFLAYMGIKTLRKKEENLDLNPSKDKGLLKDYFSSFFLTISNPLTILFFIGLFAASGLSSTMNGTKSALPLLIGLFAGSCMWWLFLSGLVNQLRKKISKNLLKKIDLVSGILILLFGGIILVGMIKELASNHLLFHR